jgi:cellulose synthase/poly-beta-1,6-N-acetylglucosamine synthase-like glycosyltransferase
MLFEDWVLLVLGFALLFYGAVTILLFTGLKKCKSQEMRHSPFVSVIVAARNEEHNLPRLLDALLRQSYARYEIVLVDDQSSDRTLSIAKEYASRNAALKLLANDRSAAAVARKKSALTTGILASKGEILCFTDADCIPGIDWLSALVRQFAENVGLVAGYSPYDSTLLPAGSDSSACTPLFQDFIRYEELKGAIWSAGSIGLGKAWLCTGRNLAYRRKVWDEVSGFSAIMASISGDDDLFLQVVRRSTKWGLSYVFDPGSFVPTAPPASFRSFVEQRKRHFSAGKYFTFPMKIFFLIFHGSNLLLFLGLFAGFFFSELLLTTIAMFVGKIIVDLMLALRGSNLLSEHYSWVRVVLMEFFYLLYNSLIGPMGFLSNFEWKPDLTS